MDVAIYVALDPRGGFCVVSIIAYVGLPGAGKTLSCVEHVILPALEQGRHVVTNVSMDSEAVARLELIGTLDQLPTEAVLEDPSKLFDYAQPGCVLVLDEVWLMFPVGVKASKVPKEFRELLAEHRHMKDDLGRTMQVVFITQDLAQIGSFARQLVETTYRTVKRSDLGLSSTYRVDVYQGAVTGQSPPKARLLRQINGTYNKRVFGLYHSHTRAQGAAGAVDESVIDRRFVVWRSPMWWLGGPVVVALIVFGVWRVASAFSGPGPEPRASVASERTPLPAAGVIRRQGSNAMGTRAPAGPEYRVVGYVTGENGRDVRAAIRADGKLVYVDGAECWQPGDGLMHCAFQGHDVTEISATPVAARRSLQDEF